jgi:ABC-type sugar transport system substrate-binding protein
LTGIYVTKGGIPFACARAVERLGVVGRVKIVAHDLVDSTMQYLSRGVITGTLNQDPFAQGHDPVILMYNHLVSGWQPPAPRLLTRLELVNAENCRDFWDPSGGLKIADRERYARPVTARASKRLRIRVLGRADNAFFDTVTAGVQAATEELRPLNAEVELIIPEENRRQVSVSADVYHPLIDSAVANSIDGVVVGVFDSRLVPAINKAHQSGVAIITYNSEPGGLRSLIHSNIEQARKLLELSRQMAEAVDQARSATVQINTAMGHDRGRVCSLKFLPSLSPEN